MNDTEIVKRKIELKRQVIFLTIKEIYELTTLTWSGELKSDNEISLFIQENSSPNDQRLNQVIGFISAISPDIPDKICSIRDHKGHLTVVWHTPPNKIEMEIVTFAWGCSPVGDGCGMMNVEHRIVT